LLYTKNAVDDRNNVINHIAEFIGANDGHDIQVDSQEVLSVCVRMRRDFPHVDGMEKASAFKKVANFVAHFLELRPVKSSMDIPIEGIGTDYDINAVIALDIAIASLQGSIIKFDNGTKKTVDKPIYISDHSYADIIHALSEPNITQKTYFHILAVLFEQIVYKTNGHCEYKGQVNAQEDGPGYYGYLPGGDDLWGV
jgi:hypothetical protein